MFIQAVGTRPAEQRQHGGDTVTNQEQKLRRINRKLAPVFEDLARRLAPVVEEIRAGFDRAVEEVER